MSNIDWSQMITAQDKQDVVDKAEYAVNSNREVAWRTSEMEFIADQLIAIEDEAIDALPGTDKQWREYRTAVRNWKEGAVGYPDNTLRPAQPKG